MADDTPNPAAVETVFARLGGQLFFDALVERFYAGVAMDPVLRPMYPDDLTESKRHLALFLAQYWGGPTTYSEQRGHPRLRMRHASFPIGPEARDAWYRHMADSVAAAELDDEDATALLGYFKMAADHLQNFVG
jgi:hemoglobin